MSYGRFAAMIATSTLAMFVLMYLNTYAIDHVYWSETRTWMAVLMGAAMAVIMLAFMRGMYKNRKANIAIFAGSALIFALSLWLVRSQATVSGVDYMRAMIPHHSIAVLTSERAQIVDPRVRDLANQIIGDQRREIAEMKYLIRAVGREGPQQASTGPQIPPEVVPASEALSQVELARVDLAELDPAEIDEVLGSGPRCEFAYSRHASPVAAAACRAGGSGPARGVIKVQGRLVAMHATCPSSGSGEHSTLSLEADGIEVVVTPIDDTEAEALLRIEAGLEVGYGGFYRCEANAE